LFVHFSYRKLSLKWHPDKNVGNEEAANRYVDITKAYETLTDPAVREKWEKYGNPDGPQSISMGIALPSWLVDKNNSAVVLTLYLLGIEFLKLMLLDFSFMLSMFINFDLFNFEKDLLFLFLHWLYGFGIGKQKEKKNNDKHTHAN